jgi:hypothetical protein
MFSPEQADGSDRDSERNAKIVAENKRMEEKSGQADNDSQYEDIDLGGENSPLDIEHDHLIEDFVFPGMLEALEKNIELQSHFPASGPITEILSNDKIHGDPCVFQVLSSDIVFETTDPIGIALHMPWVSDDFRQSTFFSQFSVCDHGDDNDFALDFGKDIKAAARYISAFLINYFGYSKDSSFSYKTWDDETGFDSVSNPAPLLSRISKTEIGSGTLFPESSAAGSQVAAQASSAPQEVQRSGVPVSVVVILILVTAMFAAIFAFAWSSSPESEDDLQVVSVYVSGSANARDQPSAQGSSVLETYDGGTHLTGVWVSGASDPDERWLKFEGDGQARYIWDGNLSFDASEGQVERNDPAASITSADSIDFVRAYIVASNSGSGMSAADVVNTYYDDKVLYFGGSVDRSHVLGEKARYERRWPERIYQMMEDAVQTDCVSNPMICSVSGTMWYSATSEERGAYGEGYAEFTLGVRRTNDGLKIVSETSRVVGK